MSDEIERVCVFCGDPLTSDNMTNLHNVCRQEIADGAVMADPENACELCGYVSPRSALHVQCRKRYARALDDLNKLMPVPFGWRGL